MFTNVPTAADEAKNYLYLIHSRSPRTSQTLFHAMSLFPVCGQDCLELTTSLGDSLRYFNFMSTAFWEERSDDNVWGVGDSVSTGKFTVKSISVVKISLLVNFISKLYK